MVIRPEIPNDLKEQFYQLSRDKASQGGEQHGGGYVSTSRSHNPLNLLPFRVQARSSQVCIERKTIMFFLHANTHIPVSAHSLSEKFIKPFLKICTDNEVESTLV